MLSFAGQTGESKTVQLPEPVYTDIIEVPAIIVDSVIAMTSPEFRKLKPETLSAMATAMSGIVGYIKVEAYYTVSESANIFCTFKDCWRPAEPDKHRCDSHPLKD